MKLPLRKCLVPLGALLLALFMYWLYARFMIASESPRLAITLIGVETDPGSRRPVRGPTIVNGATGLCAVFFVTNTGMDGPIWFDTSAVEQREGTDWKRIPVPPYATRAERRTAGYKTWQGIAGESWPPGTGWYMLVEWPPDVPTNALWRLELHCGPEPSERAKKWDERIGFDLFARRKARQIIYAPEVRQ